MKQFGKNNSNHHFPVNYLKNHPESLTMKKGRKASALNLIIPKPTVATSQKRLVLVLQVLTVFGRGLVWVCLALFGAWHEAIKAISNFVSPVLDLLREWIILIIRTFNSFSDTFTRLMDAFFLMDEKPEKQAKVSP